MEAALVEWAGARPRVVSVSPRRITDVLSSFGAVARAVGAEDAGHALTARALSRFEEIGGQTHALAPRPSVACLEWLDPPMGAGSWMPELVAMAGGRPLFGEAGEHSPTLSWQALREADPDVLVFVPCGFDIARTRAELATREPPPWAELRAVREGRALSLIHI